MKKPIATCRSCGAAIVWAVTARGVRIPLDAEPNPAPRTADTLIDSKQTRYMPHHATCRDAKAWRR